MIKYYRLFYVVLFFKCVGGPAVWAQDVLKHEVYFTTDQFNVIETEVNRLSVFIDTLKTKRIEKISIFGFCDDRGSDMYNLKLSLKRAEEIKALLISKGVNDSLVSNIDGKGEVLLKLIDQKDLKLVRSFNRKVEVSVVLLPEIVEVVDVPEKIEEKKEGLEGNLKVGDKVLLDNLLFKTGHSYLIQESIPVLENIAKILRQRDDLHFTILGHVCCTSNGRDAIDEKTGKRNLSLARAKYVYDYLSKNGIKRQRMRYLGMKHKYPLGGSPKFDRRVEIEITFIEED